MSKGRRTSRRIGSAVKVEFGEITDMLDVPNAVSDRQSLPLKYIQPLIHVTTTPSRVSAHLIDGHSTLSMLNQDDELLTDAIYHNTESSPFKEPDTLRKAISSCSQGDDYIEKIKDLQVYLDLVEKIVKPGCSQEMLEVALSSMSLLVRKLSVMSSKPKPHSSL
ncbi:pyrophosphate--fructose 6-phosphate 1-phosphotransferase subunit alpha-like isoform X2 [Cornus florida]|uniref:pyrophosphate--fructose 6-phosphate 1-phosphotransferase subunit alpha-like isoform X2 n=1 Tax=Cornus florida TaxID=4283 RepID=UPI0028971F2B|nr:pyrophosphate--fructose 6-phosphate 1-phosphotransferase subunit alpha-like isoform X2 [Cornus florida]